MKWISFFSLIIWTVLIFIYIWNFNYLGLFHWLENICLIWSFFLSFWLFVLLWKSNKSSVIMCCLLLLSLMLLAIIKFDDYLLVSNIYWIIINKIFDLTLFYNYIINRFFIIFLPVFSFLFIYCDTSNDNKKLVNKIWCVLIIVYFLVSCLKKIPIWSSVSDIHDILLFTSFQPESIIANVIFFLFVFCLFYKIIRFIFEKIFLFKADENATKSSCISKKFIILVLSICLIVEWFLWYHSYVMNYYTNFYSTEQEVWLKPNKFISNRKLYYSDDYWNEKSYDYYLGPINYWWCVLLWPSWVINEVNHSAYMCEQNNCLKKILSIWDKECKTVFVDYE